MSKLAKTIAGSLFTEKKNIVLFTLVKEYQNTGSFNRNAKNINSTDD